MAKRSRADVKHAIDLLWTHQLRRENAFLHKQVKQLQDSIDQCRINQVDLRDSIRSVQASADETSSAMERVASTVVTLQADIEKTPAVSNKTHEQLAKLSDRVNISEANQQLAIKNLQERIAQADSDVQQFANEYRGDVATTKARLDEMTIVMDAKVGQASLEDVHIRVQNLENHFAQHNVEPHSVSIVQDSIDHLSFQSEQSRLCIDDDEQGPGVDSDEERDEQMLTLRNIELRESTGDESFDLDGNVAVPSYARHLYRPSPVTDSLQPIEKKISQVPTTLSEIYALKQGRYHSWERYLAEGQSLFEKIPKTQEALFVQNFIEGLYAAGEREQARKWLDLSGWSWDNVSAFLTSGTPSIPVHANRQRAMQRVAKATFKKKQQPAPIRHKAIGERAEGDSVGRRAEVVARPIPLHQMQLRSRAIPATSCCGVEADGMLASPKGGPEGMRSAKAPLEQKAASSGCVARTRSLRFSKLLTTSKVRKASQIDLNSKLRGVKRQDQHDAHLRLDSHPQPWSPSSLPSTPDRDTSLSKKLTRPTIQTHGEGNASVLYGFPGDTASVDEGNSSDNIRHPSLPPQAEAVRRKRRQLSSNRKKRVPPPPPEIPILSTSED
ncbi:uncharacterized protein HMPREF1541_02076 [Cyphellophora europaea CBS 101466]|uniref:Uncharacterized protein n=1 Tax=Cyphellophora europaea (strain CBS 101466) TaxID=1220924 RepID=W2S4F4_CYPE1|nr:uncharacterized protein HMPREF1541_02076 [Cyphellophora europaea CBS 101466]ETN42918.1 hypothetical protein HMPREF1541_02076 [Cyphellophora europaea CBS 101466]